MILARLLRAVRSGIDFCRRARASGGTRCMDCGAAIEGRYYLADRGVICTSCAGYDVHLGRIR